MRIRIITTLLLLCLSLGIWAQVADSMEVHQMETLVVVADLRQQAQRRDPLSVAVVRADELKERFTGNLMQGLDYLPGVQSLSIGSGFSKPMIRGAAFNRVSVTENGIKQEGQQWGADHGLEIDAFNVERVNIRKGPSSLQFGSDAMGGVVEILPPVAPVENQLFGSVYLLGRTVNGLLGGSAMVGLKQGRWFVRARYSEQQFADVAVPTDTIIYLTQKIPIADRRLNNTAGMERAASLYSRYAQGRFSVALALSDAYQKVGFFPAAHGLPDASLGLSDGDRRNVSLPYSFVNHFKAMLHAKYVWDRATLRWDLGYQNNHREEWSEFHTHYDTQEPPAIDPDRELAFMLDTYSSGVKLDLDHNDRWESTVSWDLQYQNNRIAGYGFLLPAYRRITSGLAWVTNYRVSDRLLFTGGLRYDVAAIHSDEYKDHYLAEYLTNQGYGADVVDRYAVRSYGVDRRMGDYSLGAGLVWDVAERQQLRVNVGRSFRLPAVNELASNGVHHGSFMHEQGDPTLDPEHGWQADAAYHLRGEWLTLHLSPFVSWYQNYIYLQPSGEWSILPHAGQVYRFRQSAALLAGGELSLAMTLPWGLRYEGSAEYLYTRNLDEHIALPYSPPTVVRNRVGWRGGWVELFAEWQFVAAQTQVSRNEDTTPAAHLFHTGVSLDLPFLCDGATAQLRADNLFDTMYLNHLSYYRRLEIPEPGRNIQLSIKIPFSICKPNPSF